MAAKSKGGSTGKKVPQKAPQKRKGTIVKKGYEVPPPPHKKAKKSDK